MSIFLHFFFEISTKSHTYNIKLKQVVFYMDTKQAENINDCIKNILEGTTCPLELKPIPVSNADFPKRKKKRKKRYRSIGLFWDGYEILIWGNFLSIFKTIKHTYFAIINMVCVWCDNISKGLDKSHSIYFPSFKWCGLLQKGLIGSRTDKTFLFFSILH